MHNQSIIFIIFNKEGNFTIIVDGFIVSDNVTVTSLENVVTGFVYSDHNPVVMKFKLK